MLRFADCKSLFFVGLAVINSAVADEEPVTYQTLNVDGVEREWLLFVPSSYASSYGRDGSAAPVPLVLEFHGSGSTPEAQQRMSDFPALAEEQGFLLVAPKAAYARPMDDRLTWNVDRFEDVVDDVAFTAALIEHLQGEYRIDPKRIYATGFSGGARMSSRVACDLSLVVAAVGPVGGVRYPEDCAPARPVPVITFHGRNDGINHYEHQDDSPNYWRMGVEEAIDGWLSNNACEVPPVTESLGATDKRLSYENCRNDADVVFHRSEVANHTWPGTPRAPAIRERWGADTVSSVPATQLIWAFFEAHPLPAALPEQ